MYLVQMLLPFTKSAGAAKARFDTVLDELTTAFGGATAFVNSPAQGLWENDGERQLDRIVTVEVMVDEFNEEWWTAYRKRLEARFGQQELVVRVMKMTRV